MQRFETNPDQADSAEHNRQPFRHRDQQVRTCSTPALAKPKKHALSDASRAHSQDAGFKVPITCHDLKCDLLICDAIWFERPVMVHKHWPSASRKADKVRRAEDQGSNRPTAHRACGCAHAWLHRLVSRHGVRPAQMMQGAPRPADLQNTCAGLPQKAASLPAAGSV